MEITGPRKIEILEPIGAAVERTSEVLFRPFNLGKWFVIGFIAWLAAAGTGGGGGGGNFNFNTGDHRFNVNEHNGQDVAHELNEFKNEVISNLPVILFVGVFAAVLIASIVILLLWIRSRGQFIFLNSVARNKTDIIAPWSRYARQGNSLFLFKLLLMFINIPVILCFVIPLGIIVWAYAETEFKVIAAGGIVVGILMVLCIIFVSFLFGIITHLTNDLVVPMMYTQNLTVTQAWKRLLRLISENKLVMFLYLLFIFLIGIGLGIATTLIGFAACCCLCCVSWMFCLPLIGSYLFTVLTLPLWVWRRAFSAYFLAQFGPEYNVFFDPDALAPAPVVSVPSDQTPHAPDLDFI